MPTTSAPPTVPGYVNRLIKALLRSPLHPIMSKNTMLLSYVGRRSGKDYVVAVRYLRDGNRLSCYTDSRWWINFRGGAPVRMRVAGQSMTGVALPVTDATTVSRRLSEFLNQMPADAKYYGVRRDAVGRPVIADIAAAAERTTLIEIDCGRPRTDR
jgi:hypothetical protein